MKIKTKLILLLVFALGLFFLIGSSYAYYQLSLDSTNTINLIGSKLSLKMTDEGSINIDNAEPVSDRDGLSSNGYNYTITNDGNMDSKYYIYLNIINNTLPLNIVKYSIISSDSYTDIKTLSELDNINNKLLLKEGSIKCGESINETLKLWISENADSSISNSDFNASISVVGEQINKES